MKAAAMPADRFPAPYDRLPAAPAAPAPVVPQEPQAGGSYVRNADGTLTCTQRTESGGHDGRRRHAAATHNDAHQE